MSWQGQDPGGSHRRKFDYDVVVATAAAAADAGDDVVDAVAGELGCNRQVAVATLKRVRGLGYDVPDVAPTVQVVVDDEAPLLAVFAGAELGACRGLDPDLFFPERGQDTTIPKSICARCVVSGACLEFALTNCEKYGIWGGMSERARRRIRRQRAGLVVVAVSS